MLLKQNRVTTKEVEKIFKEGKFINLPFLSFKFIKLTPIGQTYGNARISFIASKNIAKTAVLRNSLRRKGYDVLKKYIKDFPLGLIGVFIFRKISEDKTNKKSKIVDKVIIENEIKNILSKIN